MKKVGWQQSKQLWEMRIPLSFLGIALGALGVVAGDTNDLHKHLVSLAANNGGVIPLDADLFDKLTAPDRTWSATVQLTALGKVMKCTPCRYTHYSLSRPTVLNVDCQRI
jgi:OST3 / OST6 family, transporter family